MSLDQRMADHSKLEPSGYTAISVYLAFLMAAGIVIQYATIKILLSPLFKAKKLTPYLLSIVFANSAVIIGAFPTSFAAAVYNGWVFSDVVCKLNGLVTGIGCIAMLVTMMCISWKIYETASANNIINFTARSAFRRYQLDVIIGVWLFSIFIMLPPTLGWTDMMLEMGNMNCVPTWAPQTLKDAMYIIFLTVFGYFIPVMVSAVFLLKTRKILRNHTNILRSRGMYPNNRLNSLVDVYRMQFLAISFFVLTWFPYVVYVFISMAHGDMYIFSPGLTTLPALVAKASVIFNPIIYAIVIPR